MGGFKKFLLRGNLVELAVAVVIGATFSGLVQALVKDLITPLIAAITGAAGRTSPNTRSRSTAPNSSTATSSTIC